MNFFEQVQQVLDYIAGQAGIDRFELDEEGRAFFEADAMTFLFYALEEEAVLVPVIYIGQPDPDDADFLYSLLTGNHLWEATGGGSLSLDPETGHLCLQHRLCLPLDPVSDAEPFFAGLLGAAQYWKRNLPAEEIPAGAEAAGLDGSGPDGPHFIRV